MHPVGKYVRVEVERTDVSSFANAPEVQRRIAALRLQQTNRLDSNYQPCGRCKLDVTTASPDYHVSTLHAKHRQLEDPDYDPDPD